MRRSDIFAQLLVTLAWSFMAIMILEWRRRTRSALSKVERIAPASP